MTDRQMMMLIGVGAVALLLVGRRAADTVGGIVTGDNALTEGTPYEGWGVLGSLGAATNAASGGKLREWGEAAGSWLYDALNPAPSPEQDWYMDQLRAGGYPAGGLFRNAAGTVTAGPAASDAWVW